MSSQNGWVYDPNGLSPCLSAGQYVGVEPKIIEHGCVSNTITSVQKDNYVVEIYDK